MNPKLSETAAGVAASPEAAASEQIFHELEALLGVLNGSAADIVEALACPKRLQLLLLVNLLRKNGALRIRQERLASGALRSARFLRRETRLNRGRVAPHPRLTPTRRSDELNDQSWAALRILRRRHPGVDVEVIRSDAPYWVAHDAAEVLVAGPVDEVTAFSAVVAQRAFSLIVLHPKPAAAAEAGCGPNRAWDITIFDFSAVAQGLLVQCIEQPNQQAEKALRALMPAPP